MRFDGVMFDLLTALIDSWSLWIEVAGDADSGRRWRRRSLELVTRAGAYVPYEDLVFESSRQVGLGEGRPRRLLERWGELRAWPEVKELAECLEGRRLGVVTNCSQDCAERAAAVTGLSFDAVVSAERAGFYKPNPRAYRAGLDALALPAERVLFVAGSPHDVPGAQAAGLTVYWSNRLSETLPATAEAPMRNAPSLSALCSLM